MNFFIFLLLIARWGLGLLLILLGLGGIQQRNVFASSLLIIGLYTLPPVYKWFHKKYQFSYSKIITNIAMVILSVWGINSLPKADPSTQAVTPPAQAVKQKVVTKKPEKVNYKIIEIDDDYSPLKIAINIRLPHQVSEKALEGIAHEMLEKYPNNERYFMLYFLPDMPLNNGCWATTHHEGSLRVHIMGASAEEEEMMKTKYQPETGVIGRWYDLQPYVEVGVIFFKQDGVLKLRWVSRYDDFEEEKLFKKKDRFYYKRNESYYFKIDKHGDLEWWDETDGKPIKFKVLKKVVAKKD